MKPGSYVALMPRERAAYDDLLVRKARLETELSNVRLTLRRIRQKANERGRSTTLQSRLAQHRASGREFDEVRIIPCDEATSIWLERELIRTLKPTQNLLRYRRHAREMLRTLEGAGG